MHLVITKSIFSFLRFVHSATPPSSISFSLILYCVPMFKYPSVFTFIAISVILKYFFSILYRVIRVVNALNSFAPFSALRHCIRRIGAASVSL